jgi:hypothetical protein
MIIGPAIRQTWRCVTVLSDTAYPVNSAYKGKARKVWKTLSGKTMILAKKCSTTEEKDTYVD